MRPRRTLHPLAGALSAISDELTPQTLLADVQRAWSEVVGAAIADEAEPVSERSGVVTVACGSAVWAQELDLMGPEIVERLNLALPQGRVERLRCVAFAPRQTRD